jgi:tetratricopeptide (TPR) repeat protein
MSLKKLRDLNPTSRDQVARAKTAIQSKNHDYAISLLQAVLKDEPLFLEGRQTLRAVEIQKYDSAGTLTRQMTTMRTSAAAMKLSSKKTPPELLVAAEEILAVDPYNQKANVVVGDAGMALGYPEFKCFAYETLAKSKASAKPGDKSVVPILTSLGQAYMDAKDYDKAISTYDRILEIDPRNGDALSAQKSAQAAKSHTGWEEAQKTGDYREALKDEKEAGKLEQEGKVVKSSDAIQEQIDANYAKHQAEPNSPLHSKAIAMLMEQRNDFAGAVPWYEHAYVAGGSIDSALEKKIGDLKVRANEVALQGLKEQLAQETDPDVQAQLQAAIEEKEKEFDGVRLELAEARVKAQPNEGEFRYDLGAALFKVGQYKRATEELQQALKQPSVRYPALNLLGLAFMKRNMLDFAINRLTLAQSELPSMQEQEIKKEITYNLGLAHEANKDPVKALDQYKMIYEVDMSYRDVAARVEASYGGGDA